MQKYVPLLANLSLLLVGALILVFSPGHEAVAMTLLGAAVGQFAPSPHTSLQGGAE